jgi:exonuclease I
MIKGSYMRRITVRLIETSTDASAIKLTSAVQNKITNIIVKITKNQDIASNLIEGFFADYDNSKVSVEKLINAIKRECKFEDVNVATTDKVVKEISLLFEKE